MKYRIILDELVRRGKATNSLPKFAEVWLGQDQTYCYNLDRRYDGHINNLEALWKLKARLEREGLHDLARQVQAAGDRMALERYPGSAK